MSKQKIVTWKIISYIRYIHILLSASVNTEGELNRLSEDFLLFKRIFARITTAMLWQKRHPVLECKIIGPMYTTAMTSNLGCVIEQRVGGKYGFCHLFSLPS